MKRIIALIAALALLMVSTAFAEVQEITFGPFSLTIDVNTPGEAGEFASGAVFMTLYPAYLVDEDQSTNMKFVWVDQVMGLGTTTDAEVESYALTYAAGIVGGMKEQGLTATEPTILDAHKTELDGKPAMSMTYSYTLDYSGLGEEYEGLVLELTQWQMFVETETGTYIITSTVTTADKLQVCEEVLNTLRWTQMTEDAETSEAAEATEETETTEATEGE